VPSIRNIILKKFTPLIVLTMFAIGVYFMIQGMKNATNMANPQNTEAKK